MLFPDTSPRGAGIEGEDDDYDFGTGERTLLALLLVYRSLSTVIKLPGST